MDTTKQRNESSRNDLSRVARHAGVLLLAAAAGHAGAVPPIWETDFGGALPELDDASESERTRVNLPFQFPFDGVAYDSIWVYVGGVVTLGTEQELPAAPDSGDLTDLAQPAIAPFWSDVETNEGGDVRLNQSADRVIITWDNVHADSNEDARYRFQAQLFPDGAVVFGYDGPFPIGDDTLNADLIVGVADGSSGSDRDFVGGIPFSSPETTIYDFFEENDPFFPLSDRNVVFTPNPAGGYVVDDTIPAVSCDADLADPIGELNFFDVATYLDAFQSMDPSADLAEPFGVFNFFDITAYIAAFNAGCP